MTFLALKSLVFLSFFIELKNLLNKYFGVTFTSGPTYTRLQLVKIN